MKISNYIYLQTTGFVVAMDDIKHTFKELEQAIHFRDTIVNLKELGYLDILKDQWNTSMPKFSTRTTNCLQEAKIETFHELRSVTLERLLKIKGMGETSINEIKETMKELGYTYPNIWSLPRKE